MAHVLESKLQSFRNLVRRRFCLVLGLGYDHCTFCVMVYVYREGYTMVAITPLATTGSLRSRTHLVAYRKSRYRDGPDSEFSKGWALNFCFCESWTFGLGESGCGNIHRLFGQVSNQKDSLGTEQSSGLEWWTAQILGPIHGGLLGLIKSLRSHGKWILLSHG